MKYRQKKILAIALAIFNISFTTVVASVATVAWFASQANVSVNDSEARIQVPENAEVDWEVLKYNDDLKAGVSSTNASDFSLQPYDEYLTQKNKNTNVLLRATLSMPSITSANQLYVDVSCTAGHDPEYNSAAPKYTSNICQFKSFVYSYVNSSNETVVLNHTIDPASANSRYTTATTYFAGKSIPSTRFVALHNNTPNKRANKITLIPNMDLNSDTATSITVYIECSYNPKLVKYYITSNGTLSGVSELNGDITLFNFRVGAAYTGAYVKVNSASSLTSNGNYLIGYDGFSSDDRDVALDGSGTTSTAYTSGKNYIDYYSHKGYITNNENYHNSDFSYDTSTSKLTSRSGYVIGATAAGNFGASQTGTYTNSLTYDSGSVDVVSNSYNLQYNPTAGTTRWNYYSDTQTSPNLYKLDTSASASLILTGITLGGAYPTSLTVGDPFTFSPGTVTASYNDGEMLEDVTSEATFTGYNMSAANSYTVTVSYTDPDDGSTATALYALTVQAVPTLSSIAVSGMTTAYNVGDTFSFDGVCTATFSNGSTTSVTPSIDSSNVNMSTAGTYTVGVSYTNNSITRTTSYEITVSDVSSNYAWNIASSISSGDVVIIVYNTTPAVAGGLTSGYFASLTTGITINDAKSVISAIPDGTEQFTIGGSSGAYTFTDQNNQILGVSGTTNYLDGDNATTTWNVTFSGTTASLTSTASSSGSLQYNTSNPRFKNYTSSQGSVQLYKRVSTSPLSSITLSNLTTSYYTGASFVNPTITAHYEDSTTAVIPPASCTITGFDNTTPGTQTITVSYTEGSVTKTAAYNITMTQKAPASLTVAGMKTTFYVGDTFSFGGTASVTYNDGTTSVVNTGLTYNSVDMNTAGTYTIYVTYTEGGVAVTATGYTITVNAIVLDSIAISGQTTSFVVGDTFTVGSGVVTATYNNSSTANVTASTSFSGYDMSTAGTQTVTASYTEGGVTRTATYSITVTSGQQSGSFEIAFLAGTRSSDSSTALDSTTIAYEVSAGATYIASYTTITKVYGGKTGYGLKFGTSSAIGDLVFATSSTVQAQSITSIVLSTAQYSTDTGTFGIYINGSSTSSGTVTPSAGTTTITLDSATVITSIEIKTSAKRAYLKGITFNY